MVSMNVWSSVPDFTFWHYNFNNICLSLAFLSVLFMTCIKFMDWTVFEASINILRVLGRSMVQSF